MNTGGNVAVVTYEVAVGASVPDVVAGVALLVGTAGSLGGGDVLGVRVLKARRDTPGSGVEVGNSTEKR